MLTRPRLGFALLAFLIVVKSSIALEQESTITSVRHFSGESNPIDVQSYGIQCEPVSFPLVRRGEWVTDVPELQAMQTFSRDRFSLLPDRYKSFACSQKYTVSLSEKLYRLRQELIKRNQCHG